MYECEVGIMEAGGTLILTGSFRGKCQSFSMQAIEKGDIYIHLYILLKQRKGSDQL
jgi:hypothetical protein